MKTSITSADGRRLAAVMFTDIVGYSAMTRANESRALQLLEQHFRLVRSTIRPYHAREIKTIGDAFLIVFESALAALDFAIAIQRKHTERNREVHESERFEIRVGIHIGDIEYRGSDIFGDGVNIASRIQPLAPPGGLAITAHVHAQLHNELSQRLRSLGPCNLKNIATPMEVFVLDPEVLADPAIERLVPDRVIGFWQRLHWPVVVPIMVGLLALSLFLWPAIKSKFYPKLTSLASDVRRLGSPASSAALPAPELPASTEGFRDCDTCPLLVLIPGSSFLMGSTTGAFEESPQHQVNVAPFAISKFEVTFAEWDTCVEAGGCSYRPDDKWGRGNQPVMRVSWLDVQEYLHWLSEITGKEYRLLSEAEWEFAAAGGVTTAYHWGDAIGKNNANCGGCGSPWDKSQSAPVGSFPPNAYGLHEMLGNVMEWVQDCDHDNYIDAPADGSAWTSGSCQQRMQRGGSWDDEVTELRIAHRDKSEPIDRDEDCGFRIARSAD